jgi:5'-nucleotidase
MRPTIARVLIAVTFFSAVLCTAASAYEDTDAVGTVWELLTGVNPPGSLVAETELGDAAADAARELAGTDAAIVNGGDIINNLDGGEAAWADVKAVFSENKGLAAVSVTPAQLWSILEIGVSHAVLDKDEYTDIEYSRFDGFPQISGLCFIYDMSAPVGGRVINVTFSDGTEISRGDDSSVITLCATEYMLSGGYGYPELPYTPLGTGLADALAAYFDGGVLSKPETGRIGVMGTRDNPLISRTTLTIVVIALIIISFFFNKGRRRLKPENG